MATNGISTLFPVGSRPGSIQSISQVWVKQNSNSSTMRSVPTVLEMGIKLVSRIRINKVVFIESFEVVVADSSGHCGNMVHIRLSHHSGHSGGYVTGNKFM